MNALVRDECMSCVFVCCLASCLYFQAACVAFRTFCAVDMLVLGIRYLDLPDVPAPGQPDSCAASLGLFSLSWMP